MTEREIKDLMQKYAAVREQCTEAIERLKVQLACPSLYKTKAAARIMQPPTLESYASNSKGVESKL